MNILELILVIFLAGMVIGVGAICIAVAIMFLKD